MVDPQVGKQLLVIIEPHAIAIFPAYSHTSCAEYAWKMSTVINRTMTNKDIPKGNKINGLLHHIFTRNHEMTVLCSYYFKGILCT